MRRLPLPDFTTQSDAEILQFITKNRDERLKRFQEKAEAKKTRKATGAPRAKKVKDPTATAMKLLKQLSPAQLAALQKLHGGN